MAKPSETSALPVMAISNQVKRAILIVYGMNDPDPDSLTGTSFMADFGLNDYQWIELAFSFTKIIREYSTGQAVTAPDLENLVTVQDCIDLVVQKASK